MEGTDAEEQTERTPLLGAAVHSDTGTLPDIRCTLDSVQNLDPRHIELSQLCPHALPTQAARIAFALIVLLQWRLNRVRPRIRTRDIWERWDKERGDGSIVQDLEQCVGGLWSEFLEGYRSAQDIEDALWSEFLDKEGSCRTVRVIDFVGDVDAPIVLLSHRIIYLSLLRTWKHGFSVAGQSGNPMRPRSLTRFDSICTPRVLHCIELVFHSSYLAILVHFLLFPPGTAPGTQVNDDWRGLFLMAFAAASLARSWSLSVIPFLLVLISFSSCLPLVPGPGDITFSILLFALSLHTLQLHIPSGPTPIFLLPFGFFLPLCAFLSGCMSQIIFPVITLFLPIMLLTLGLLSLSLRDTYFLFIPLHSIPSPTETRIGLFVILGTEIVLLVPSLLTPLILAGPISQRGRSVSLWDRYSESVGFEARKYFVRAVLAYSAPHTFPSPFNLLPLFFQLPSAALHLHGVPSSVLAATERWLWRITIGPLAVAFSLLWVWQVV